jgi:hypothetical protein
MPEEDLDAVNLIKEYLSKTESPSDSDINGLKEVAKKYSVLNWLWIIWKAYQKGD